MLYFPYPARRLGVKMTPYRVGPNSIAFERMSSVLLPSGGHILVLVEAYFDESGSHCGSKSLCVAGYLIERKQSELMAQEWNEVLDKYNLPFFHMVDCAHHAPPFDKLSLEQCIAVEKRMIDLIKRRTVQGVGVIIDYDAFTKRFGEACFFGSAYTLCFHHILAGLSDWAEKTEYQGDVAYFFEAGHESRSEADAIMQIALNNKKIRGEMHYAGHAFVDKEKSPQVQAADLFAWQLVKDLKNHDEGRPRRKDFISLTDHPHHTIHIREDEFDGLNEIWSAQQREADQLFGPGGPKTFVTAKEELFRRLNDISKRR
jgi:hypothetical protein